MTNADDARRRTTRRRLLQGGAAVVAAMTVLDRASGATATIGATPKAPIRATRRPEQPTRDRLHRVLFCRDAARERTVSHLAG